jgi:NAD(P)-dependent dehydrogenase (short-subunit alcohol dehydrogenase family)
VQSALKSLGATHFDYLVNNAGNNHHNMAFEKTTEEELDGLYNVHFKGVFFLSQKLLPSSRTADELSTYRQVERASSVLEARRMVR